MNKAELVKMLRDKQNINKINVAGETKLSVDGTVFKEAADMVEQALKGYAVVPVEPTEAMRSTGFPAFMATLDGHGECDMNEAGVAVYKAMIKAAENEKV